MCIILKISCLSQIQILAKRFELMNWTNFINKFIDSHQFYKQANDPANETKTPK